MACKIEDCENKPITRWKYCEIHRIGKICKENDCKSYADEKDEEIRYDDLYMIHSGKWIYIRFNPDIEDRIYILLKVIEGQIERIENNDLVEIIKLFY